MTVAAWETDIQGAVVRDQARQSIEERFARGQEGFRALDALRLQRYEISGAYGALWELQRIVRRDTWIGEKVAAAAEGYTTGAVSWEVLSLAFAEWSNSLLVRYIDAAYPPENLPLEDAELLGEVA